VRRDRGGGAGEVTERFDDRDQRRRFEEDQAAVPVVVGERAEALRSDRHLRVLLVRPRRVERCPRSPGVH